MQRKTINKVIHRKIDNWLKSIKDEELAKKLKNKIIVTGGCITSMLLNEKVNDFDIYFTDKEIVKEVAQYYCNIWNEKHGDKETKIGTSAKAWVLDGEDVQLWKQGKKKLSDFAYGYEDITYDEKMEWNSDNKMQGPSGMLLATEPDRVKIIINSDGVAEDSDNIADENEYDIEKYIEAVSDADEIPLEEVEKKENEIGEKYRPVFLSENAITLSDKIQLIIRFYGDAKEIHSNYDFVHTKNYWTNKNGVVLNLESVEAIMNKRLKYTGSKYPIASVIRTRKFIKRGWHINAGDYLKMALQISKLDLNNIYVLQDQLVSVDSIYFLNFIDKIRRDIEAGKEIDLTGDYVVSVIDKVFD